MPRNHNPLWFGAIVVRSLAWLACAALAVPSLVPAAERQEPKRGPDGEQPQYRRPNAKTLTPGQEAPDFQLPRLIIETGKDGKSVAKATAETLRLSSFRGKRPVVLIFSSYT